MIELNIKPYCENCSEFEVESNTYYADNERTGTIISCANREKCEKIEHYVKSNSAGKKIEAKPDIYTYNTDGETERKFEAIEDALGIKLYRWQKSYIETGIFRRYGETTAVILGLLTQPIGVVDFSSFGAAKEYMEYDQNLKNYNYYEMLKVELMSIEKKLKAAGIRTNPVKY